MGKKKARPAPGLCYVCNQPTEAGNYCHEHPASRYRIINCSELTCNRATVRKMYGHNIYTCPEHRTTTDSAGIEGTHTSRRTANIPKSASPAKSAREQVKELLAARRASLAREKPVRQLPPRPPYNIGHYDNTRQLPRNPGMGG